MTGPSRLVRLVRMRDAEHRRASAALAEVATALATASRLEQRLSLSTREQSPATSPIPSGSLAARLELRGRLLASQAGAKACVDDARDQWRVAAATEAAARRRKELTAERLTAERHAS